MSERLLIVGTGGHAKEVLEIAEICQLEIAGFYDENATEKTFRGFSASTDIADFDYSQVVIAVGDNAQRRRLTEQFVDVLCEPLLHPRATISPTADIQRGTMVMPGAVISADAKIGRCCIVGQNSYVGHDCVLGDWVHVATGCMINGVVNVGAQALIGSGAVLLPGITVGEMASCGAGATVTSPVTRGSVVVGTPAKPR